MSLSDGVKFGRYEIEKAIGHGGMGQVFRAHDTVLSRIVALKVMRPELTDREQAVARFHREARLAAQLTHPNTVHVYDLGEVDQTLFIAMEYVEGKPLTAYCNDASATVSQKLTWMMGVARALAAAHKVGLLHRDVKPSNIMVSAEGIAKVVDFGLAKGQLPKVEGRPHYQTQNDHIVGTPEFMAPEQLEAQPLDARADQFAWGLTMHALFLGYGPRRKDPLLRDPIPRLDVPPARVNSRVADVVARSLEIDKSKRFASMDLLADALEAAVGTAAAVDAVRVIISVPPPDVRPAAVVVVPSAKGAVIAPTGRAIDPERWNFQRIASGIAAPVRYAAFSPNGGEIVAVRHDEIVSVRSTRWKSRVPRPSWLDPADVRCVAIDDEGRIYIGGARGLAGCMSPNGRVEQWRVASGDSSEIDLLGVDVEAPGNATFVGQIKKANGIVATIEHGLLRAQSLDVPAPLTCTAKLADGRRIVAGARGVIATVAPGKQAVLFGGAPQAMFHAAVATGDRVILVGTGGYAVSTDGNRFAIEPVETTTDLRAVAVSIGGGALWAASDRARIVRRNAQGTWKSVSGLHKTWEPSIVAISALKWSVRAVASDGGLVEGTGVA